MTLCLDMLDAALAADPGNRVALEARVKPAGVEFIGDSA
jgi:hypothetical protein